MKRQNLKLIETEEREDSHLQGPEIIEENVPNLKKKKKSYKCTRSLQNTK